MDRQDLVSKVPSIMESLISTINSLSEAILKASEKILNSLGNFDFLDNVTFTRKKFIKMLMSIGIQRNAAKEIADYYHFKENKYTLKSWLIERNKWEEREKNENFRNLYNNS